MFVRFSFDGVLGVLTLNRPEKLNAIDMAGFQSLSDGLDEAASTGIRALIITGEGSRSFSVGADIGELQGADADESRRRVILRQSVIRKLASFKVPTIAVMNGFAMGGGLELALACTFRLATPNARFSMPEIKLGLIPGCGGTQLLPRLIGTPRALDLLLTGRTIDAKDALRWGLVDRLVTHPLDDAKAFATQWTAHSPIALAAMLAAVRASEQPGQSGFHAEAEQLAIAEASADAAEGKLAFLEKRTPVFRGL